MSIFDLINNYQLQIAVCINLTLGLLQCGSSSWILYDVNYEEKLLYSKAGFQLGLKIEPKQWQWQPTYIDRFIDFRPLKKQLELLQICTSLCLVCGATQSLISAIFLLFKDREEIAKKVWFSTNIVAFLGIISCFSLILHNGYENGWKDKISMKLFSAVSGTHCFITLHLLAVMGWDLYQMITGSNSSETSNSLKNAESQSSTRPISLENHASSNHQITTVAPAAPVNTSVTTNS